MAETSGRINFDSYATGSKLQDSDWTVVRTQGTVTLANFNIITEVPDSLSGKTARSDSDGFADTADALSVWDGSPTSTNWEVLFLVRHQFADTHTSGVALEVAVNAGVVDSAFLACTRNNAADQRWTFIEDGQDYTTIASASHGINKTEWFYQRAQANGSDLKLKTWAPADITDPTADEPLDWELEITSSSANTSGAFGIAHRRRGNGWFEIGYIGWGVDGVDAPAPEPGGGAVTLLPNFISSDELVYNHTVSVGPPPSVTLLPNFISSSESLYLPTLLTSISTTPDFIVSSESFYLPQISPGMVTITPDNILTGEVVYPPSTLTDGVVISPDTILTDETVYLHSVSTSTSVSNVQFIFSEEDMYALNVAVGQLEDVFILDRIASNEEFYAHNIISGEVFIQLQALIASGELFYNNRVYDPSSSLLAVGITDRLYEALYSYKGTVNDKLFAYLRDQSLTGTLSDMIAGYGGWKKLLKDLNVIQTL